MTVVSSERSKFAYFHCDSKLERERERYNINTTIHNMFEWIQINFIKISKTKSE